MLRVRHLGSLEVGGHGPENPRERHLAAILGELQRHGPDSRASIAERCGLGTSTLSELVGELRGRRLVTESAPVRTRTVGRPLRQLRLDGDGYLVAAVHLAASRSEARLATLGGRELGRAERRWEPGQDDAGTVITDLLRRLLVEVSPDQPLLAVEVGVGGVIRRATGRVINAKAVGLHDRPLGDELLDHLDRLGFDAAVGIDNDCNFAALATVAEAGPTDDRAVTIYVGGEEAVGGTVLVGPNLLRGAGGAGEIAHWVVDPRGRPCWCGRRGCLCTVANLRGLLTSTGMGPDEAEELVRTDRRAALARVDAAADAGDPGVDAALQESADGLTSVLHGLQALLDPERVLIGGFLGALGRHLEPRLSLRWPAAVGGGSRREDESPLSVRTVREPCGAVVDGALLSARTRCLEHPLHFSRSYALPD
ncbi:putative NBD/HSP70 family sugar kinase [Friedmanniella endophytica]|uniref:Putative NBD/HSP70 family sugar kinase n=1 Tax=Microlunatus kandeliicorticis TaxID=1759536 RepID=A0A7W3P4A0_9ACTN|nr:ROK family protein [Microlunatus kandeliicorticis]MBA8792661.1 putative NBD/HSP70 family sugar kinase [Microlunatus kandeliicorticis]